MIRPTVGELLHFADDDHRERLLWRPEPFTGFFCIDVDSDVAVPLFRRLEEFQDLITDNLIQPIDDPWQVPLPETGLSPAQRQKRDDGWDLIAPLVASQPKSFHSKYRSRIIADILKTTPIRTSRQSLYRLIRRYWQRSMTPNALPPDYANSGAPGMTRAPKAAKRGRPTKFGLAGTNVDANLRAQMKDVATCNYGQNRKIDIAECHKRLLETYFMDTVIDPTTGRQSQHLRRPYPSLVQFRYWMAMDNDMFEMERRRRTPRSYDKDMRGILGTSTAEVIGPGSRWQIDATIADICLVSRMDRSRIVGRPTLYFVIDVFSRMITGMHVGLEAASWVGAMSAIVNAASDKVAFCQQYGIEIDAQDWPCQCLPDVLLGDRGEMIGERAEVLTKNFKMRRENTPSYRADLKGIVEKRFDLIQTDFGPYVPGYVEPGFRERGTRDSRLEAELTIDEFIAVIISCVLTHNNVHRFGDDPRDAQMIADDVQPIPIELWEWGITRRSGELRRYPEEFVRLSVLPEDHATVTSTGIRFFGCFYSSADAIAGKWFDKARQRGNWKTRISYDPRCMDVIWLHGDGPRPTFTTCALTKKSEMWRDRTLWEIDQIRQADHGAAARHAPATHEAKAERSRRIRKIASDASEKAKADARPGDSDAKRIRGLRDNHVAERETLHKERAVQPAKDHSAPPDGKVVPSKPPKPVMSMTSRALQTSRTTFWVR